MLVGFALVNFVEHWCDIAKSVGPCRNDNFARLLRLFPYGYKALALIQMPLLASQVCKSVEGIRYSQQIMDMFLWALFVTASAMLFAYVLMWYVSLRYLHAW